MAATLDPLGTFETDIHLIDPSTGVTSRLTNRQEYDADPVWGPDSDRIAYSTGLEGLVRLLSIGEARDERLFKVDKPEDRPNQQTKAEDWSGDGKTLLVRSPGNRVFQVSLDTMSSKLWIESEGHVDQCKFSPDGHWIAYGSNKSGTWEVYVAAFRVRAQAPDFERWRGAAQMA